MFPLHINFESKRDSADHWVLFVCDLKAQSYFFVDSARSKESPPAHYLDKACDAVKQWTGKDIRRNWVTIKSDGPKQANDHDCGVILCICLYNYAKYYSSQAFTFQWSSERSKYYRRLIACQLTSKDIYYESRLTMAKAEESQARSGCGKAGPSIQ
jgi:Ulp1 family protease